jgi:hypothetical protein
MKRLIAALLLLTAGCSAEVTQAADDLGTAFKPESSPTSYFLGACAEEPAGAVPEAKPGELSPAAFRTFTVQPGYEALYPIECTKTSQVVEAYGCTAPSSVLTVQGRLCDDPVHRFGCWARNDGDKPVEVVMWAHCSLQK